MQEYTTAELCIKTTAQQLGTESYYYCYYYCNCYCHCHCHGHYQYYSRLTAFFSTTTLVTRYQERKTSLDLNEDEARDDGV